MVTAEMEAAPGATVEQTLKEAREELQMLEYEFEKLPEQLRAAVEGNDPDPAKIVSLRRRREEMAAQLYVARVRCKRLEVRAQQEEIERDARSVEKLLEGCNAKAAEVQAARGVLADRLNEYNELSMMHGRAMICLDSDRQQLVKLQAQLRALIDEAAQ